MRKVPIYPPLAAIVLMICSCAQERQEFGEYESAATAYVQAGRQSGSLGENPTLEDYLRAARANNPALDAARQRWKAALEELPQARSLPDPRFAYGYEVMWPGKKPSYDNMGPDGTRKDSHSAKMDNQMIALTQDLPLFTKLQLRHAIAIQEVQARQQDYQAELLKLDYEVARAYYEYYYLARSVAVTAGYIDQLRQIEDVARSRYAAAAGSQPDVIRAQVELGKMQNELESMRDMRGPVSQRLRAAINQPGGPLLPWPEAIQPVQAALDDGQAWQMLLESSPQLKALGYEVAGAEKAVELSRQDFLPDFMLGLEYKFGSERSLTPMIGLSLPIWFEKYSAAVRQAQARQLAALREKTAATNMLSAELKMAAYEYRNADRKVRLYRDTLLPRARQALQSTRAAYQSGKAVFADLIDAQRILLEFELAYERAVADTRTGLAKIEMMIGRKVPAEIAATSQPASRESK
ncbi:MAG: TolC family protein [Planctomycetes bacterium]|nr:TolC family protein [Planctomycetota bacterium]